MKSTELKFYICKHCGNIILLNNSKSTLVCCGEEMKELVPNTTDASAEKHVPAVSVDGGKVTVEVGSTLHPMTEQHYIEWIYLKTEQGGQYKVLTPNEKPSAEFALANNDKVASVFAYCNLHGLWKADI